MYFLAERQLYGIQVAAETPQQEPEAIQIVEPHSERKRLVGKFSEIVIASAYSELTRRVRRSPSHSGFAEHFNSLPRSPKWNFRASVKELMPRFFSMPLRSQILLTEYSCR